MSWTDKQREAFESNRLSWDERVEAHWESDMYQRHAADLRAGRAALREDMLDGVGDVTGQSLVHLQCHMGMETLSWALLGADVVGLDFSQPAIEKANLLRDELKLKADFHCANVYDAVETIDRTFDIVFVSVGSVCWLPDIERWGDVVGALLKPGGRFYMNEVHPFTEIFDDHPDESDLIGIAIKYPYGDSDGLTFDEPGSYAAPDTTFEHNKTIEHIHVLGSTVNALIHAGLTIDRLDESTRCMWPRFKAMEQVEPDNWSLPGPVLDKLPHTFTLKAHKPAAPKQTADPWP